MPTTGRKRRPWPSHAGPVLPAAARLLLGGPTGHPYLVLRHGQPGARQSSASWAAGACSACPASSPSPAATLATAETKTGKKAGHGSAVAGLILGYICVVPMALITILFILGLAMGPTD
ncbi:MAG: hypothetical protein JWQ95_1909 [Sphaerisporangium sp.]|nr:hypothetical protein [Sphaerisporangium sp.]